MRFVAAAEKGIVGRLKATLGPDLIDQRQNAEFERQMAFFAERRKRALSEVPEEVLQARFDNALTDAMQKSELMAELFDNMGQSTDVGSPPDAPDKP